MDLTGIADSPDPVDVGSGLTYTIKVTSTSANEIENNVRVRDKLPPKSSWRFRLPRSTA